MSRSREAEDIIIKAESREKECDWLGAAGYFEKALDRALKLNDLSCAGDIQESIGYCFQKAAMQTVSQEEFRERMQRSAETYESAGRIFEKMPGGYKETRFNHCRAMVAYANFWLEPNGPKKKKLLDESLSLEKKRVIAYERDGIQSSLARAYNDLIVFLHERLQVETNGQAIDKLIQEVEGFCGKAIEVASKTREERELARACYNMGHHYRLSVFHQKIDEESEKKRKESIGYLEKSIEISEKLGDSNLLALASLDLGLIKYVRITLEVERGLEYFSGLLKLSLDTKDNYLIAWASWGFAVLTFWLMWLSDDPEKQRAWRKECVKHSENTISHASRILSDFTVAMGCWFRSNVDMVFGYFIVTRPKERRTLRESSVEIGRKGIEHSKRCGYPEALAWSGWTLSTALYSLADMETEIGKKRGFLEEALKYHEQGRKMAAISFPYDYWNLAAAFGQAFAMIKAELAEVEEDKETKVKILREASKTMKESESLALRYQELYPDLKRFLGIANMYQFHGMVLNHLFLLTRKRGFLTQLVDTFEGAALMFNRAGLNSWVAEALWETAKVHDILGQHEVSAQEFLSASKEYGNAANKIPSLKSFFLDYALYMQAWSEVETARHNHKREEYSLSKHHYDRAAEHLQSSESWSYIATNFLAWSALERAEGLSRKENTQEAIEAFKEAHRLFIEAKLSLESKIREIQFQDERDQITKLTSVSEVMKKYCNGRILIEQAKISAEKDQCLTSAEDYEAAARVFQEISEVREIEEERDELLNMILLCQAWGKMELAEERESFELYEEAAELFMRAQETSPKKSVRLLAAGNASFCRALAAGTKFEITRDMNLYSVAKQHMASAANYYMRAGSDKASTWVNAAQTLFDAYVYTGNAEATVDSEEKARLYKLGEKYLERSANLYESAGHVGKRDEVLRIIAEVTQKREFVLSLGEVLETPSVASSTMLISTPSQANEVAVGLERFNHAEIQAKLFLRTKEVKVGGDVEIEIELVNIGRTPALLTKIEEMVPESFEVKRISETYRVEDHYLNMKGKGLGPLKTEEIKIVLKPAFKGSFILNPRIMYLDDTGKYKAHEPEPITITVKELGISGWLKGP